MREDIVEWLALANSPGLGSVGIRRLVDRFGSAGSVLSASISDLREVEQIGLEVAREIRRSDCAWAHAQLASCATHNVDILTLADSAYPSLLLETFSPPPLLLSQGRLQSPSKTHRSPCGRTQQFTLRAARRRNLCGRDCREGCVCRKWYGTGDRCLCSRRCVEDWSDSGRAGYRPGPSLPGHKSGTVPSNMRKGRSPQRISHGNHGPP